MKCIVCHNESLPDHDLCKDCDAFKIQLEHYATSHKRRALITGTLVYYGFNVVDLEEDRECPIKCGYCCCTGWASVLSLRYKFGESENGQVCPHLKEDGCELPREKRPNACVAFLCPLAWHVTAGRMTVDEAKTLLAEHEGNAESTSASLDKRQIKGD
jgi:hypothetical protein